MAIQLRATPESIEKEWLVLGELVLGARIGGAEHDTLVRRAEDVRHAPGVAVNGHGLGQIVHPLTVGRTDRLVEDRASRDRRGTIRAGGRLAREGRKADQQDNDAGAERHTTSCVSVAARIPEPSVEYDDGSP